MKTLFTGAIALSMLCACTAMSQNVIITSVDVSEMPPAVHAVIAAERPEFVATEVQKKVRGDRVYYDVEGELSDETEIEFDILMDGETAQIVEIQRDLNWADLPRPVQDLVTETETDLPVRIIESVQTDGSVIYEFFAQGAPADPAYEIRSQAGQLERLTERWIH